MNLAAARVSGPRSTGCSGKAALLTSSFRSFSVGPVAEVIDAMPDGRPEEVMRSHLAVAEAVHGRVGLLVGIVELTAQRCG
jgi:hypothetical protein